MGDSVSSLHPLLTGQKSYVQLVNTKPASGSYRECRVLQISRRHYSLAFSLSSSSSLVAF